MIWPLSKTLWSLHLCYLVIFSVHIKNSPWKSCLALAVELWGIKSVHSPILKKTMTVPLVVLLSSF